MTATIGPHQIKVVLVHPQIAPNTGNIARLCVAAGAGLHLVRPFGFVLSDKNLRRSAMDYWHRLKLTVHDDTAAFIAHVGPDARMWMFDSAGRRGLWDVAFADGDWLVFGSESRGLEEQLLARDPEMTVRIPQIQGERCLNLSTATGIALYEAVRQVTSLVR